MAPPLPPSAEEDAPAASLLERLAASCVGVGGESFTAGTKVLLAGGGTEAISELKAGQKVLATNTKTGKSTAETIAAVWVRHDTNLYDLTVKTAHGTAVINTTSGHLIWDQATWRWVKAAALKYGTHLHAPRDGQAVAAAGHHAPRARSGWMWDLTIPGDHDFCVMVATTAILVHNVTCEGESAANDPAASRPYLRVSTRRAILAAADKTPEGDFIDPNTREVIPKTGPLQIGHKPGHEWWRIQQLAREEGWTREQLIEYVNDPNLYQVESPSANMSRRYEAP